MAKLELKHIHAYYKQKDGYLVALNDINMTIDDGDVVVVIGPSGCGKSTLLKSITGALSHVEGEVLVDDINYEDVAMKDKNFSYVSQEFDLFPTMTVYDNIAFPLKMMKTPIKEIEERVKAVAEKLDISILLTRKPKQLSLGQQQRVSIGRALIKHPSVLLFDEPFSNLDASMRNSMRHFVKDLLKQTHITTIFVTHDKEDALHLADKVAIIDKGSLIYYGDKQTLITNQENQKYSVYLNGQ